MKIPPHLSNFLQTYHSFSLKVFRGCDETLETSRCFITNIKITHLSTVKKFIALGQYITHVHTKQVCKVIHTLSNAKWLQHNIYRIYLSYKQTVFKLPTVYRLKGFFSIKWQDMDMAFILYYILPTRGVVISIFHFFLFLRNGGKPIPKYSQGDSKSFRDEFRALKMCWKSSSFKKLSSSHFFFFGLRGKVHIEYGA